MKNVSYFIMAILLGTMVLNLGVAGAAKLSEIPKTNLAVIGSTLTKHFDFEPFAHPMPDHLWMDVGNGHAVFLHFNKPVTEPGAMLLYIGEGIKGRFCAENQPDGGKTGYVHFHSLASEHGHGGRANEEGHWLRHIAIANFEMMKMPVSPGIAYNFMPTVPPSCNK